VRENAPFDEYKLIPVENKLDELYEEIKTELTSIEEIVLPTKILELEIGNSFRQYVLNEELKSTGKGNFTGENFNQFYNQIYLINERINRAAINYLRDFIYFKGDLFKA
jgi:hypothetical protein